MKSYQDTEIHNLIHIQEKAQQNCVNLIASESYAPRAVLDELGSVLTNKYSEGYPSKRYYPGNKIHDEIELLAQKRALQLFHLSTKEWGVNVQPYSGAIANAEIYAALLMPKDVILALDLTAGGHLSHGSKVSITGKLYRVYHYGIDMKYHIDYAQAERLAKKYKPKLIISGASAYPFGIDFKKINTIAKKVGAYHLTDISHYAGLIASGKYPSPFLYADIVMSTTHKSLFGPRGAIIWSRVGLSEKINKAVFPGMQGGPHINTIAGIATGLAIAQKSKPYYAQVIKNTAVFAKELQKRGCILVGNGTESHLLLLDVRPFGLHGGEAERMLEKNNILANRNIVFGDVSVQKPSAVRMGLYAMTQRGMKERDIIQLARIVYGILSRTVSDSVSKKEVHALTRRFPIIR